ncbi:hypothetical protein BH10PSE7_BH10PSE7_38370 [soil metagenome]
MLRKALLVAAAGMLMGATFGTPASATPYLSPVTLDSQNGNIENAATVTKTTVVRKKKRKGVVTTTRRTTKTVRYDRHRHGNRYAKRQGRYTYYYGGYYYDRPWWTIGVPGLNLCIGC